MSQPSARRNRDVGSAQIGHELTHDRKHEVGRVGVVEVERLARVQEAHEVALRRIRGRQPLAQPLQLGRFSAAAQAGDEPVSEAVARQQDAVGELALDVHEPEFEAGAELGLPVDIRRIVGVECDSGVEALVQAREIDH